MTPAYVFEKIFTNSLLIFFFYSCFATLIVSFSYLISEEIHRILEERREEKELQERSTRPVDAVIDEVYEM